jgi:hypothetical protein
MSNSVTRFGVVRRRPRDPVEVAPHITRSHKPDPQRAIQAPPGTFNGWKPSLHFEVIGAFRPLGLVDWGS